MYTPEHEQNLLSMGRAYRDSLATTAKMRSRLAYRVRQARDAGASWRQIAAATGVNHMTCKHLYTEE